MTLLLLAGTAEARTFAHLLAGAGIPAIASLAGATRAPLDLGLPTRIGGFGGEAAFRDYLASHGVTALVDATHPFAAAITARTVRVCAELALPYLRLTRPPWAAQPGDDWTEIEREEEARHHIPPGATVFLATGRQTLSRFAGLAEGRRLIVRRIDAAPGPFPFADGEYLVGRPPFPAEEEAALFARLGVDWLVVKNAGGKASASKLVAARALELPVLMIRRPPEPAAARVTSPAQALSWARAR
ncbi:precorrin-6x reductase [Oceanicola granulosus HTCC2516]|uniref:Precorrin-6x reductase n=1 Tax=Oceanicola granulosus (strain ATCC BAA-861 / DSM 15982 / KCTC 12143 / HTCC2516) TaxID=314256 RepID=Q2CG95_OCEGH|nr:cobalt-precorrin-6A reductase [Oceanicola granulosus]EAR51634.1 precorrin-6x reductase [Oceanicola granulosus HTCC2516]